MTYRKGTKLSVEYLNKKSSEPRKVEFNSFSMIMLDQDTGVDTGVEADQLYELKRAHPIVDFVGNLKASGGGGEEWLVFIQISLQTYKDHKSKLVDMFKRNSRNTKNKTWSLYTEYINKFSIGYTNNSKNVLLLYISPQEKDVAKFRVDVGDIVTVNQKIHVGLLAKDAPFYQEMENFEKMQH